MGELDGCQTVPAEPFLGHFRGKEEAVDWAVAWLAEEEETSDVLAESYVNLIPTTQGGTHVNGLRAGLTEAMREFCEFRNLLPRGVKLAPEDVWARCCYVLSVQMKEPAVRRPDQGAALLARGGGLRLRRHQGLLRPVAQPAHADAERIAQLAIDSAQTRLRAGKQVKRKTVTAGPALPGKLADCTSQDLGADRAVPGRGRLGRRLRQAGARQGVPGDPAAARQDPEHLGGRSGAGAGLAGGARHRRGARRRSRLGQDVDGLRYGKVCILADADSDGAHIATLLCALFLRHFRPLVARRPRVRRHAAALPHRRRQGGLLRPRRAREEGDPRPHRGRGEAGQAQRAALQGPGRDEPAAAARDHHDPRDAPPGAARPRRRERPAEGPRQADGHAARQDPRRRPQGVAEANGNLAEVEV